MQAFHIPSIEFIGDGEPMFSPVPVCSTTGKIHLGQPGGAVRCNARGISGGFSRSLGSTHAFKAYMDNSPSLCKHCFGSVPPASLEWIMGKYIGYRAWIMKAAASHPQARMNFESVSKLIFDWVPQMHPEFADWIEVNYHAVNVPVLGAVFVDVPIKVKTPGIPE